MSCRYNCLQCTCLILLYVCPQVFRIRQTHMGKTTLRNLTDRQPTVKSQVWSQFNPLTKFWLLSLLIYGALCGCNGDQQSIVFYHPHFKAMIFC